MDDSEALAGDGERDGGDSEGGGRDSERDGDGQDIANNLHHNVSPGTSVFSGYQRSSKKAATRPTLKQKDAVADVFAFYLATEQIPFEFLKSGMISDILHIFGIDHTNPGEDLVTSKMMMQAGNASADLRGIFKDEVLKGCFTYDGWTRHNRKFNGATFHYLDPNFESKSMAIGFEEYTEASTSDIIEKQLGKYYVIQDKMTDYMWKDSNPLFNQ
jgi:hypothetical protein